MRTGPGIRDINDRRQQSSLRADRRALRHRVRRRHPRSRGTAQARSRPDLGIPFIFKSSYDKANRSSAQSYRGPGLKEGLRILGRVAKELDLPLLSDVHRFEEIGPAAEVLDILQIPAFLCRQTDFRHGRCADQQGREHQERAVPRALGHQERRRQSGLRRAMKRSSSPNGECRSGTIICRRHARPADHARVSAIRSYSTPPIRCSSPEPAERRHQATGSSFRI